MTMIGKKFFTIFLIVTVAVALLVHLSYERKQNLAKKQISERFQRIAGDIERQMHEMSSPTVGKIERTREAVRILSNGTIDSDVVVFTLDLLHPDNERPHVTLIMYIVDESAIVHYINYSSEDTNSETLGSVFLSSSYVPPRGMRFGVMSVSVPIKVDNTLSELAEPYSKMAGEFYYLNLPQMTFDNIMNGKGQFILFDKNGNELDRVSIKELLGNGAKST
jgi:hypothetical protein